jgi:WhiB family redox-sensing transcriptional regulator
MSEANFGFRHDPWTADAACNGLDPDMFFPQKGETSRPAKQVCLGCPVREECLSMAVELNLGFGIFGGLSARERRVVRRERGLAPPMQPPPDVCSKNHPMSPDNVIVRADRGRRCKTCFQEYQRGYQRNHRAELTFIRGGKP